MFKLKKGPVLLLGEGDFSFSVSYQPLVPSCCPIVSTSFLGTDEVKELHKNAKANIAILEDKGVEVYHSIDATKLEKSLLNDRLFERIIFNFPHIGGKSNIKKNRQLLKDFFPSAIQVLKADGDICVTLAQGQGGTPADTSQREWHDSWQVVAAASYCDLVLREIMPFNMEKNYPLYNSSGFRSQDRNFYTKGCLTYKFGRSSTVTEPTAAPQDVSCVGVVVDGKNVLVNRYIANKIHRNLLCIQHHPLQHTSTHALEDFKYKRAAFKFTPDNYEDISAELPLLIEGMPITDYAYETCCADDASSTGHLRTSLLESVQYFISKSDKSIKEEHFYTAIGPVYRKVDVEKKDVPIQHELCVFAVESDNVTMEKLKGEVESTLMFVMMNTDRKYEEYGKPYSDEFVQDVMDVSNDEILSIRVNYRCENEFYQNSCNQVEAKGPQQLKKDIPKVTEHTKTIGYIGRLKFPSCINAQSEGHESKKFKVDSEERSFICVLLKIDTMAQIRYDIPDQRLFWSENPAFGEQFSKTHFSEMPKFKPLCLFPPLWRHDISFWENPNENFNERRLCDIIRDVSGDLLVCVILTNVWEEPGNTGRVSRCYREVYHSFDVAISHSRAHAFQNAVRLTVAKEMGVELR